MKSNARIQFVKLISGKYDPSLGGYTPKVEEKSTLKQCSITPVSKSVQFENYGTRDQTMITVALLQPYREDFDHVLITCGSLNLEEVKFHKVEEITLSPKQVLRLRRD